MNEEDGSFSADGGKASTTYNTVNKRRVQSNADSAYVDGVGCLKKPVHKAMYAAEMKTRGRQRRTKWSGPDDVP